MSFRAGGHGKPCIGCDRTVISSGPSGGGVKMVHVHPPPLVGGEATVTQGPHLPLCAHCLNQLNNRHIELADKIRELLRS